MHAVLLLRALNLRTGAMLRKDGVNLDGSSLTTDLEMQISKLRLERDALEHKVDGHSSVAEVSAALIEKYEEDVTTMQDEIVECKFYHSSFFFFQSARFCLIFWCLVLFHFLLFCCGRSESFNTWGVTIHFC